VDTALDLLLAATLVWLAWRLLADRDLVRAAILFIAFGLFAALAWARLGAADIALAEAAIGSVLTGVLILDAAAELRRRAIAAPPADAASGEPDPSPGMRAAAVLGAAAVAVAVAVAAGSIPRGGGLGRTVEQSLGASGVDHGVTGVLLAFRAWDTLLEVAVLLGALAAVLIVRRSWGAGESGEEPADPPALWLARLLAPLLVLCGGYLLWAGGAAPGGAFQAGALLAGAILLPVVAGALRRLPRELVLRAGAALGVLAFLGAAAISGIAGPAPLRWPAGLAYELILTVEAAIAVSVGVTLAVLFLAAGAASEHERGER
jgi:multisubunit Na+/H+ antiporter MnhB subunit